MTIRPLFEPAWSPDGKIIVCIGDAKDKSTTELVAIDVETGKQRVFAQLKYSGNSWTG